MADRFIVLALTELELLRCIREDESGEEVPDAIEAYLAAHRAAYAKDAPKVQRPASNGHAHGKGRWSARAAKLGG